MSKNVNLAKLFLIVSLFIGTLFVFLVPSFNSPDEDSHFIYSYQLSRGKIKTEIKNKTSVYYVPNSILDTITKTKKINNDRDKKYSYSDYYFDQLIGSDYKSGIFLKPVIYNSIPIAYLAPTIGIQITDYLHAFGDKNSSVNVNVMLQFARFFSLLIYSIIGYFAIKITPKYKNSFFAILLLPLSLFLRSMVTYDGLILVTVALVIANLLKLIYDEKINFTKKYIVLFIITGFILFNIKTVYSLVFLGAFAIDKNKFGSMKKKIISLTIIIISVLLLTFLNKLIYIGLPVDSNYYISKQMNFIKNHPLGYFNILIHNIYGQIPIQEYWMLGTLGYLDTYLPILLIFILKIYLVIIIINDIINERISFPIWLKIGYLLLIILAVLGMYTFMYLSWTPVVTGDIGGNIITGIQGRYFIPFLLFIPIIFENKIIDKIKNKRIKEAFNKFNIFVNNYFYYITIIILIITIIFIFMRYYC